MDNKIAKVALAMMERNCGDIKRIEHTLKVSGYARLLGVAESLDERTLEILELTAFLHDIGIHVAEKKYGRSTSHYQEMEGPPVARDILTSLDFNPETVDRVCFIISKHHTFTAVDGIDFQLLVEADFLVNSTEDHMSNHQILHFAKNIFKSECGLTYLKMLFPNFEL
ncbi:MAG TPA: HD domain-containing protein [Prolixibacteraceae bacterium]|nr:HD domain-containing protein [Prolixibacteraceae bacterium]